MEDQELVEICNKIYQKHKRALELIYENKSDSRSANTDLFLDALKQYEESGDIVIDKNNTGNTVINFYTKKMDKYMPQDDSYTNSLGGHSIYRYYLDMKQYPNITMTFELLGLGFDPIYLNIVNEITQICKPGDSRVNFKYKKLYTTKSYTVDEDNIEESCKKNIYSLMQDILKKQDDIISKIE